MSTSIDHTSAMHDDEDVTDPWNPGFTDLAVPPVVLEGELDVDIHARRHVEVTIDMALYRFSARRRARSPPGLVAGAALVEAAL